jgi:hypothetical protein
MLSLSSLQSLPYRRMPRALDDLPIPPTWAHGTEGREKHSGGFFNRRRTAVSKRAPRLLTK